MVYSCHVGDEHLVCLQAIPLTGIVVITTLALISSYYIADHLYAGSLIPGHILEQV